jgi:DNA-binding LacI/PurR family transcriptional regulator
MKLMGSRKRFDGFVRAVREAGLPIEGHLVKGDVDSTNGSRALMNAIVEEIGTRHLPTGIVAVNDAVAIGAMESLLGHGVRIPEDVSIIGYDDINIAGLLRVPLTTIHQPKFKMGEIAARQLVDRIERGEQGVSRQFLVEPTLVIRKSCCRVHGADVRCMAGNGPVADEIEVRDVKAPHAERRGTEVEP